jgi:hypothetical protein
MTLPLDAALGLAALVSWLTMAWVGAYDAWRGYDSLAHWLAGYAIGTGTAVVYNLLAGAADPEPIRLLFTITAALAVSTAATLVWEAFEFEASIYPWVRRTSLAVAWADTEADAAWVGIGAMTAAVVVVVV